MAQRPVYSVRLTEPFYRCDVVDFSYNAGMAVCQKQKNILAIHNAYRQKHPADKVLEISSKSLQSLGVVLSAFNLLKEVPSIGRRIPVENVYQGAKIFTAGGPFLDLYETTPKAAKKDGRLLQSGDLAGFFFEGTMYPLSPPTAFYNWIYILALLENDELARQIGEFDAFTDIEFNPLKGVNCQARAAAMFVSLYRSGKLDAVGSFAEFLKIYNNR